MHEKSEKMKNSKQHSGEKLLKSEKFLSTVMNAIQNGISVLDRDLNIVYVNPWMHKMYASSIPLEGKKCYEAYHGRNTVCKNCPSVKVLKDGNVHFEIVPYTISGKTEGWLRLTSYPLLDQKDNIIGVIENVFDITEIMNKEELLRESEEKYRLIIENSMDAVLITTSTGEILSANRAAREMFKMTEREICKAGISGLIDPSDYRFQTLIKEREKNNKAMGELTLFRSDGIPLQVEISTAQFYNKDKKLRSSMIIRDLTDRKRMEEVLNSRERELATLMGNLPGMAYRCKNDEQWTMLFLNDNCEPLTGYRKEDVLYNEKISYNEIIHPEDREFVREQVENAIGSGDHYEMEYRIMTKQGKVKWVWEKGTLRTNGGESGILEGVIHDIDDRKIAEEELEKYRQYLEDLVKEGSKNLEEKTANLQKSQKALTFLLEDLNESREELIEAKKMAESANKSKSVFLAKMSHDIRTPINAILGFTQLLSSQVKNDLHKNYLQPILISGKALLSLIDDILDLSKIEVGKLELNNSLCDLKTLFKEIYELFLIETGKKGLSFSVDIGPDVPNSIYIDEGRMRQILINLLSNAVKFTDKGYIKLSLSTANKRVEPTAVKNTEGKVNLVMKVEDSGIGISEGFKDSIFESFTQANLIESKGGTGLGLAITSNLVSLMNGEIDVESEEGRGSTFTITLFDRPFSSREEPKEILPEEVSIEDIEFEPAQIMVLDDNYINRKILEEVLKGLSLKVIEAENGKDALAKMSPDKPDLILADLQMPVMDGFEFITELKKDKGLSNIPVIACTALAMKEEKERIARHKFDGMLIKPIQLEDVYKELMKYLPFRKKQK